MKPWELNYGTVAPEQSKPWEAQYETPPAQIGAAAFPETLRQTLSEEPWLTRNLAGFGTALTNLYEGAKQVVGQGDQRAIEANRIISQSAPVGAVLGNAALLAPTAMVPGANTAVGAGIAGAVAGALQPTIGNESRAFNTALGGAFGMGGQAAAQRAGPWLANRLQQSAAQARTANILNQPKQAVVEQSRNAGYVMPPAQVNPSGFNRAIESVGGKVATQQTASLRNQSVTDALVRRELGLPSDTPLTPDAYSAVRNQAGQVYEQLRNHPFPIAADKQYTSTLDAIQQSRATSGDFGPITRNDRIDATIAALRQPMIEPSDAVTVIKQLRADANTNLGALTNDPDRKALGYVQKRAAGALEDLVSRNLANAEKIAPGQGYGDLASRFAQARTLIAKSVNAEKATEATTGHVDARKLGAMLQSGKPLSGGLETAAEFGRTFDKAAQLPEKMGSPVSATQALASVLLGMAGQGYLGGPGIAAAALPLARPLARALMMSKPYQAGTNIATASPAMSLRLAEAIVNDEMARKVLPALAAQAIPRPSAVQQ